MIPILIALLLFWMPRCLYTQSNEYGDADTEDVDQRTRGADPETGLREGEDSVPQTCIDDLDVSYRHCCIFPPFFGGTFAAHCGAVPKPTFHSQGSMGFRRYALNGCDYWKCILKEYHLLDKEYDGYVNVKMFYKYLDKWISYNNEFNDTISGAKQKCLNTLSFLLPLEVCNFHQLSSCIRTRVNQECPRFLATDYCREWKKYYDDCGKYLQ